MTNADLNPIFHVNEISAGRRNRRQSVHDLIRAGLVWTGAQHGVMATPPSASVVAHCRAPMGPIRWVTQRQWDGRDEWVRAA